jgi:hypothetical protein
LGAERPTRSTRTDPSVTIRPLILTLAQGVTHIRAETDVLQLPAAAGTFGPGAAAVAIDDTSKRRKRRNALGIDA